MSLSVLGAVFIVASLTLFIFLTIAHSTDTDIDLESIRKEFVPEEDQFQKSIIYDNKTYELSLIFSPLYTKIDATRLMNNVTRANIYELVIANPGITFSSITRELRISKGTAQYHLRVLDRHDCIVSRRTGKQTRYYSVGTQISTFSETQERIVKVIKEKPGISQIEIAKYLDISRQLVNYHIKKLADNEIILVINEHNFSSCFIIEEDIN